MLRVSSLTKLGELGRLSANVLLHKTNLVLILRYHNLCMFEGAVRNLDRLTTQE